jgi:inosine-uridine nucleoside N-ribohydrolase
MQKKIEEFSQAAGSIGISDKAIIPVLIYCDPGIDDAVMLAHALTNPRFAVLGIICSAGNTSVENTVMNALRICEISGRTEVKVYAGAKGTLLYLQGQNSTSLNGVHVYGAGGLGKTQLPLPKMEAQQGDAVDFAVDTIIQSKEPVAIISTAGLTDVYLMLAGLKKKNVKHLDNIKVISMMGGAFNIAVHANAPLDSNARWAEFNLIYDADASSKFFEFCATHGKKIIMAPTDLTHEVLFSTDQVRELKSRPQNPVIALVADLLADVPEWYRAKFGHANPSQPLHDLMATLCLSHPGLFIGEWTAVKCSSNDADKPGLIVKKDKGDKNNVFVLSILAQHIPKLFDSFFNDLAQSMPAQKNSGKTAKLSNPAAELMLKKLQDIVDLASESQKTNGVLLTKERQEVIFVVNDSMARIITGLKEVAEDCEQFMAVDLNLDPINYCLMSLPVIVKQIQSIMKTTFNGINVYNHIKKQLMLKSFQDIADEIESLIVEITPKTQAVQLFHPAEERALQDQQALLTTLLGAQASNMQIEFQALLESVRIFALDRRYPPPDAFVSYARATNANQHELWVQNFLTNFCNHLGLVGIVTYLDIINSTMGYPPAQHMARIRTCTHAILIGTLSLAEKELGKGHMVQTELNYIREAIRNDKAKIIPLLLSGDYENAFPIDFLRYTAIEAFREMGYLRGLQAIIKYLFVGEEKNEAYDFLWLSFNQKYLQLFPAPKDCLAQQPSPKQSPRAVAVGNPKMSFAQNASNGSSTTIAANQVPHDALTPTLLGPTKANGPSSPPLQRPSSPKFQFSEDRVSLPHQLSPPIEADRKIAISQALVSVPKDMPAEATEALVKVAAGVQPPRSQLLDAGLRQGVPLHQFQEHSDVVRTYDDDKQQHVFK